MIKLAKNVWKWLRDPIYIKDDVNKITSAIDKMKDDIYYSNKRNSELTELFHSFESKMEEHLFLDQVNKALDGSVPDMFWVKNLEGKYLITNKAIREGLIFCDEPYGKTDRQLASEEITRIGADNHTFGAKCANSDLVVLEAEKPMKFNEDGLVKGKYLMLQVHKNVIRNSKGDVIGTVGVGRDITFQVTKMQKILESTKCEVAKKEIDELLNYYKFEDDT